MITKSVSSTRQRVGQVRRRRAFRPTLERFEARRLLSVSVLTYHNDGTQGGLNPSESLLTPANVNSADFGKLFSIPVDGQVYAQPLYVSGLSMPGQGTHNVVFVATQHDSVYAFDSDTGGLLWHDSFINPAAGITTVPSTALPSLSKPPQISPEVGISSTPVIDPNTNTLYVVAYTMEVSGSTTSFFYRLHALDITTGAEKFGGPVAIQAEVNGTGAGADSNGDISFNALYLDQRDGLLLLNGVVYFGFASWNDYGPYHGWLLGYSAQTLQQVGVFNDTPNGSDGGIWQGSGSFATDGTYIYFMIGNGTFDTTLNASGLPIQGDYGDSFVKLAVDPTTSPANQNVNGWGLTVVDYFTPDNQQTLDSNDLDLGSGGVMLLPPQSGAHPDELLGAGKQGTIYVIDRDKMGHFSPNANHIVQELDGAIGGNFSTGAYFNGDVYYGGERDSLKEFAVTNGLLSTAPVSRSGNTFPERGTTPSISANGASNGIVWTVQSDADSGNKYPAILHAYDATNLANELFNSTQVNSRNQAGLAVNFIPPTIANGHVYVPAKTEIDVYGLLSPIADTGFEQVSVGAGQFQYNPTGSPWTFSGQSGISGNSSTLSAGNPPAPEGSQVAFLEQTGSFSQPVTEWTTGVYVLSFEAAQRASGQTTRQNFEVEVDGTVVGTFTPTSTMYQSFTTPEFTLGVGTHTITFQGLDSAGGDNMAFVDAVMPVNESLIGDPGFEQVALGAGKYQYRPSGSPWTFTGNAGITGNGSGFTATNPPAPEGSQVAFLQSTGSFSQAVVGWADGSYTLTFSAAQRANYQASKQNFSVEIDGAVIGTFTPAGTSYQSFTTTSFTVTAGVHTITFQGLDSAGGDNTAFIDQVAAIAQSPVNIGLVAAYSFDEGSGTTVADASGNGNTGTISNATWTIAGQYGTALMFDGSSSLVTINDSASLDLSTGMTLEAWVNPSAVNVNWEDVVYKGNNNYGLEAASTYSGGMPAAEATLGSATAATYGAAALTPGIWTYLTETYNGSSLDLYINGTLVSSVAQTGNILTSSNPLQIGGDSIYGQYFAGMIDEVRVYNVALTPTQIQADMNTPVVALLTVASETPTPNATGVAVTSPVTVTFNESVQASTVNSTNFTLTDASGNPVAATVIYTDSTHTATLTPNASLANAATYTVTVSGITDSSGNVLSSAFVWSFTTAAPITDAGFEQPSVGTRQFQYDPAGSPWTFSGNAGISANNSGFTSGNPPAPEGTQVAFLQGTGSFSQATTGWAPGTYTMSFSAAQRSYRPASRQNFSVQVDGVVVNTFTPSGTSYQSFTTAAFTVSAGAHTVTFQGLDSVGGDNTVFIDAISVAAVAPNLSDAGFEQPSVGAAHFQYDPPGLPWSFSGSAGISGNNSGFTASNPLAPEGTQVGFLQGTGSFSQTVSGWAAGSYTLTFLAAQRGNYQTSHQNFNVLIDGVVVGSLTPSSTSYQSYSTAVFIVTAGSHIITFQGLDSAGGDNTAFIDDVAIA